MLAMLTVNHYIYALKLMPLTHRLLTTTNEATLRSLSGSRARRRAPPRAGVA